MNGRKTVESGTGAMDPAKPSIELAEYTINHQLDQILQDIFRREPDVIAFSCYIWNIEYIRYLIADLRENTAGCAHMAGRTGGVL